MKHNVVDRCCLLPLTTKLVLAARLGVKTHGHLPYVVRQFERRENLAPVVRNELDHFSSQSNGLVTSGKGFGLPSPDIYPVPKTAPAQNVDLQDERSEDCRSTVKYQRSF
jgi:hypothetical protein